MSVLERIVDATRADVARRRRDVPLAELEQRAAGTREDRPFSEALTLPGISVIAEYKRRYDQRLRTAQTQSPAPKGLPKR